MLEIQPLKPDSNFLPLTGIEIIDVQHEDMLAEIRKLEEANLAGRGGAVLDEVFIFLADYSATHFAFEEFVMKGAHYPKLEAHRQSHEAFARRFRELGNRFQQATRAGEDVSQLCMTIADWLHEWLVAHIQGEDTAMATYLCRHRRAGK